MGMSIEDPPPLTKIGRKKTWDTPTCSHSCPLVADLEVSSENWWCSLAVRQLLPHFGPALACWASPLVEVPWETIYIYIKMKDSMGTNSLIFIYGFPPGSFIFMSSTWRGFNKQTGQGTPNPSLCEQGKKKDLRRGSLRPCLGSNKNYNQTPGST